MPNGAVVTSRSPISTSCEAPTAWSCVSQAVLSNPQVIVRGINATKVLDVNKQVKKGFFQSCAKIDTFLSHHIRFQQVNTFIFQLLYSPYFFRFHSKCAISFTFTSQLCAGLKIEKPTPDFFTYSGKGPTMAFNKLKYPVKDWNPAYRKVRDQNLWQDTHFCHFA